MTVFQGISSFPPALLLNLVVRLQKTGVASAVKTRIDGCESRDRRAGASCQGAAAAEETPYLFSGFYR
jgi:hypothetical protein